MTLLQERDEARRRRRLEICEETRRKLRETMTELLPRRRVIVFGSLTHPGTFNDCSDVDVALESEPSHVDVVHLTAELSERLQRAVDVVVLDRCRFRDKILREGETWTL